MAIYDENSPPKGKISPRGQKSATLIDEAESNETEIYKTRKEPSMLQKYSERDPQFLIDKGVMQQDIEEFAKFKRQNINLWGSIS